MVHENFPEGAAKPEDRQAKQARQDREEPEPGEKRDELILIAQLAAESRAHAANLFRTFLVPSPTGETYYDAMKEAVGNYEKSVRGKKGHGQGIPAQHATVAALLTKKDSLDAASEQYELIEKILTEFDTPSKLGRHILEFRGYETKERGHRFRVNVNPAAPEDLRKALDLIFKDWAAKGEEVIGPAPPSKRERQIQARIRRLR